MRLRLLSGTALLILSSFGLTGTGTALAQSAQAPAGSASSGRTISVRAADHGDFTRIVLDGLKDAEGDGIAVREGSKDQGGEIVVSMGSSVPVDVSGVAAGVVRLSGIETTPSGANGVSIRILAPGHERFRHVRAGNRIFLDIYGPAASSGSSEPPNSQAGQEETHVAADSPSVRPQAGQDAKKQELSSEGGAEVSRSSESAAASVAGPVMPAAAVGPVDAEKLIRPISPHLVSFTSTEAAGMAAFVRSGTLWVVFDRTNLPVDGRIEGPEASRFPGLRRVDSEGVTAFYTELPGPANVYAEGGGLVWKVVLTPATRATYPIAPEPLKPRPASKDQAGGEEPKSALIWPTRRAGKVVELVDPQVGDQLKIATVARAPDTAGPARSYVDFDLLRSAAGFVFAPRVDDLSVRATPEGVEVSRPSGLTLSFRRASQSSVPDASEVQGAHSETDRGASAGGDSRSVYDFREWTMGGDKAMEDNRRIVMTAIGEKDETGRAEDLLALARMHVANGWGPEALGFLRIVLQSTPELETNPAFLALRGAARALAGKHELAVQDLGVPALDEDRDIPLWRAVVFGGLEDWRQAGAALPKAAVSVLAAYPAALRDELAPILAEIALRHGQVEEGGKLLDLMGKDSTSLRSDQENGRAYLKAEILRQKGKKDAALAAFKALADGRDDLYRVKAGLAFVKLGLEAGTVVPKEAIDRLEGMRFGWRGDELETLVNARLGKAYLADGQYAKGLSVLRDAATLDPEGPLAADIRADMAQAFEDVFLTDRLDKLSALDAITLYDAFRDLTPKGADGDAMIRRLAEALVKADLLGRASSLIQTLIDHRLSGPDAAQAAVRLAAIDLLDGRPEDAMASVNKALSLRGSVVDPGTLARMDRDLVLLRARALSGMDKPEQALALLGDMPPDPDVNRLRVDIAWRSANWDEAAEALADLILESEFPAQGPIEPDQATLIVNRAVALALADNRLALSNMRDLYGKAMAQTAQARLFDVITRERKAAVLSDRQTLMGVVSEVDLFRNFLDSLKNAPTPEVKAPARQGG
jgi:tetratricopeptide (TPR) repeat protein